MAKTQRKKSQNGITLIRKSNDLIEARYKFDVWEMRFFLSVLAEIRMEDDDFRVYRIWYKDIVRNFNLKTHQSYDMLREGAKKLMNKSFYVRYEDKDKPREVQYHILRKLDYSTLSKGEGRDESQEYIDLTIEQEMKPFLLDLQKSFTTYELRNITQLGVYPIRIYELLKQYESIGRRTLDIEEMKRMFELENEYPRFPNFHQKVIQPAVREINKYTDLNITGVEKMKEGRSVTSLRFHFSTKTKEELQKARELKSKSAEKNLFSELDEFLPLPPQYPSLDTDLPTVIDESEPDLRFETEDNNPEPLETTPYDQLFTLFFSKVVENMGVTPTVFAELVRYYTESQFQQAIRVTERARQNGLIKTNISGYFVQALKKGYTDVHEFTTRKKEVQQQRLQSLKRLQAERQTQINDVIRKLVAESPEVTPTAIAYLRQNVQTAKVIEQLEKRLGRVLTIDDYRTDKLLRQYVMQAIIVQNKSFFQPIFDLYDEKIEQLK